MNEPKLKSSVQEARQSFVDTFFGTACAIGEKLLEVAWLRGRRSEVPCFVGSRKSRHMTEPLARPHGNALPGWPRLTSQLPRCSSLSSLDHAARVLKARRREILLPRPTQEQHAFRRVGQCDRRSQTSSQTSVLSRAITPLRWAAAPLPANNGESNDEQSRAPQHVVNHRAVAAAVKPLHEPLNLAGQAS
jgi:hypothetical protein